jgi:hypothetical protein
LLTANTHAIYLTFRWYGALSRARRKPTSELRLFCFDNPVEKRSHRRQDNLV